MARGMAPRSPTINRMPCMGAEISRVEYIAGPRAKPFLDRWLLTPALLPTPPRFDIVTSTTFRDTRAYRNKLLMISLCRCSWTLRARYTEAKASYQSKSQIKSFREKKKSIFLNRPFFAITTFNKSPNLINEREVWVG